MWTAGYVGFGFLSTRTMTAADIVVGGVARRRPYLQDYFTNANRELRKDAQQDYHLEYAMENSTHTVIEFARELHTCDINDKSITVRSLSVNAFMNRLYIYNWEILCRIKKNEYLKITLSNKVT